MKKNIIDNQDLDNIFSNISDQDKKYAQEVAHKIIKSEKENLKTLDVPSLVVLGGMQGVGKSFASTNLKKKYAKKGLLITDLDKYSTLYPNYKLIEKEDQEVIRKTTGNFSFYLRHLIFKYCIENNFNVLWESTLTSQYKTFSSYLSYFADNQFAIDINVIIAQQEYMYASRIKRAHSSRINDSMLRNISSSYESYVKSLYTLRENIRLLLDNKQIKTYNIFNRFHDIATLDIIRYDNGLVNLHTQKSIKAEVIMKNYIDDTLFRPLKPAEKKICLEICENILDDHKASKTILDNSTLNNIQKFIQHLKSSNNKS